MLFPKGVLHHSDSATAGFVVWLLALAWTAGFTPSLSSPISTTSSLPRLYCSVPQGSALPALLPWAVRGPSPALLSHLIGY